MPSRPDPRHGLAPLYEAFERLPVELRPVVFEDGAVDKVRNELVALDGVLVWVNPIQDGANRATLDELLLEVSAEGVWVSAHPSVILKLGTKEVLYSTRAVGWGVDTDLYRTHDDFRERFPAWLGDRGRVVLKQGRGNGGSGVWKVELVDVNTTPTPVAPIRVQDASLRDGSFGTATLDVFMRRCAAYFAWSGCLVAQAYQERLADGMVRCYLSHNEVAGFCHQWPRGLLDSGSLGPAPAVSVMVGPDAPAHQRLRDSVQSQWVPEMQKLLGLDRDSLPVIWDADFLYGPKTASGEDTYVLCEINVSAVWPFPPMAAPTVAVAALARTREAMSCRVT